MDDPLAGLGRLYSAFGDLSGHLPDGSVPDDALGRKPIEAGFLDTWIFNSSKAFLIALPT